MCRPSIEVLWYVNGTVCLAWAHVPATHTRLCAHVGDCVIGHNAIGSGNWTTGLQLDYLCALTSALVSDCVLCAHSTVYAYAYV